LANLGVIIVPTLLKDHDLHYSSIYSMLDM